MATEFLYGTLFSAYAAFFLFIIGYIMVRHKRVPASRKCISEEQLFEEMVEEEKKTK